MPRKLKPGDSISLSREGKVFVTQYHSIGGFASLTRVLGDNPDAEIEAMQAELDVLWHESLLRNHRTVDACYAALGKDGNLDKLIDYLEKKTATHVHQEAKAAASGKPVRRKLAGT